MNSHNTSSYSDRTMCQIWYANVKAKVSYGSATSTCQKPFKFDLDDKGRCCRIVNAWFLYIACPSRTSFIGGRGQGLGFNYNKCQQEAHGLHRSPEENTRDQDLNFVKSIFISPWNLENGYLIPIMQGCFLLVEFSRVVHVFLLFHNHLPLEKDVTFIWINLNSLHPICFVLSLVEICTEVLGKICQYIFASS